MYAYGRLPGFHVDYFARVQRSMARITHCDMGFLEKWYPRSLDSVPVAYWAEYLEQKSKLLDDYDESEVAILESWEPPFFALEEPGIDERMRGFAARARRRVRRARSVR
jgi:hypothetical protein